MYLAVHQNAGCVNHAIKGKRSVRIEEEHEH